MDEIIENYEYKRYEVEASDSYDEFLDDIVY